MIAPRHILGTFDESLAALRNTSRHGMVATVNPDGTATAPALAPPVVQAMIDAAVSGDTVLVEPGTYAENLNFQGKDVELRSTDGAAVTTLAVPGGTGGRMGMVRTGPMAWCDRCGPCG